MGVMHQIRKVATAVFGRHTLMPSKALRHEGAFLDLKSVKCARKTN